MLKRCCKQNGLPGQRQKKEFAKGRKMREEIKGKVKKKGYEKDRGRNLAVQWAPELIKT